jgi:hypothetical protein
VIKPDTLRWMGHVADRETYKEFWNKYRRLKDNTKVDLKGIIYEYVDWLI